MGHRSLASATVVAASLLVLGLPAIASAQTAPPRSAVHTTPAQLRTLMARGEKECIQPPRKFDLRTMSDAQLALDGLPARHVLESDSPYWSRMLDHYKHRSCGPDISMPRRGLRQKNSPARAGRTENPGHPDVDSSQLPWAGNFSTGARGTYQQAQVTFSVPDVSGNIGADASFWAGVGGNVPNAELVQAGVDVMICPDGYTGTECYNADNEGTLPTSASGTWLYNYAWYEVVDSACPASIDYCDTEVMSNEPIYPGDSMSAFVTSNSLDDQYDYFAVCNNTLNDCDVPSENHSSQSFSDSATGECIGEQPWVTGPGGSDYYEADFGTEELSSCYIANKKGLGQGIADWPHSYYDSTDAEGSTLVTVGSISGDANYPLYFQ
jgi:Peptidase A4 family